METPLARAMVPVLADALKFCREKGIKVIYTTHCHRSDGSDMGLFDDLYAPIATRAGLVDNTPGIEIYPELKPAPGEHVVKNTAIAPLRHGHGHHSSPVGDRDRDRVWYHHGKLLPRDRSRRHVP